MAIPTTDEQSSTDPATLEPGDRRDLKRSAIHAAAIEEFSSRGIAGTSMANIAAAAGMSRPALYQYFTNKNDIFASAFVALFEDRVDVALQALAEPGSVAEQVDALLQRFDGDLWELLNATAHADELMSAKSGDVAIAVKAVVDRLWTGLADHLRAAGVEQAAVDAQIDLLRLAPAGLKVDQPSVAVFRSRLTALAAAVGANP